MYPLVVLQSNRITQLLATDITGVPIPRMFVEYMPIQFRPVLALVITALHRAPKKKERNSSSNRETRHGLIYCAYLYAFPSSWLASCSARDVSDLRVFPHSRHWNQLLSSWLSKCFLCRGRLPETRPQNWHLSASGFSWCLLR